MNIPMIIFGYYNAIFIPAPPTTDGAYVLTATVDDGTAVFSWEESGDSVE